MGRNPRNRRRGRGRRRHGRRRQGRPDWRQGHPRPREARLHGRQHAHRPGLHQRRRPRAPAAPGHQGLARKPHEADARCRRLPRRSRTRQGPLRQRLRRHHLARIPRHEVQGQRHPDLRRALSALAHPCASEGPGLRHRPHEGRQGTRRSGPHGPRRDRNHPRRAVCGPCDRRQGPARQGPRPLHPRHEGGRSRRRRLLRQPLPARAA